MLEAVLAAAWLTSRQPDSLGCPQAQKVLLEVFKHHIWIRAQEAHEINFEDSCRKIAAVDPMHLTQQEAENLEFIGDAVLHAVVSEYLFNLLPDADEGGLTAARQLFVSNAYLARRAREYILNGSMAHYREVLKLFPNGQGSLSNSFLEDAPRAHDPSEQLAEVAEASGEHPPKCIGDIYEVMVAVTFLKEGGELHKVWAKIHEDFEVSVSKIRELQEKVSAKCSHLGSMPSCSDLAVEVTCNAAINDESDWMSSNSKLQWRQASEAQEGLAVQHATSTCNDQALGTTQGRLGTCTICSWPLESEEEVLFHKSLDKHICQLCNVEVYGMLNFKLHCNGKRHLMQIASSQCNRLSSSQHLP